MTPPRVVALGGGHGPSASLQALRHMTEAITAVVVPNPGETIGEDELLAAVKQHVDPYKVPKAVIVVDELPKTSTGKIQKNKLRARFERHYAPEAR